MDKDRKTSSQKKKEESEEEKANRERVEKKIDEELEQSFPASDPPSFSQPGNDDIKN